MLSLTRKPDAEALNAPWLSCISVGRAFDLLRSDVCEHMELLLQAVPFRYCRFHALFHDDMSVVVRREDGSLAFQWHQVDKVFDTLLGMGLRPFIELNPMPSALASGDQQMFHYQMNVTPPARYEEWEALVEAFTAHCIERYSLEEVRRWYFEVWNEPNLECFWSGTKEEYWQLYAASARAVKRVDAELPIGGPATSQALWVGELMDYCEEQDLPLDFISTHSYLQDEFFVYENREVSPFEPRDFLVDKYKGVFELVAERAPELEIHWTEWNTLVAPNKEGIDWVSNDTVDTIHSGAFIAYYALALDAYSDGMSYWVASDIFEESPIAHSPFGCTYGLITIHGIPKSGYHALAFLALMRGERLALESGELPPGAALCATQDGQRLHLLLVNYQPPECQGVPDWKDTLKLSVPKEGRWIAAKRQVKAGQGSCWESWVAMGRPQDLTPGQQAVLEAASVPSSACELLEASGGSLSLDVCLASNEVLYVELSAAGQDFIPRGSSTFRIDGPEVNLSGVRD